MAGGTIASLNAALRWDLDDFDRGTAHIEGTFGRLRDFVGGVADSIVAAGRRMTLGITLPLAGLAVYTVKAASDAEELQSAFDYTFGAMAETMNEWAVATGDAMGRSTQEMQRGAFALGGLFNAAAPTREAAAQLSQQFVELAQDAGSFFNVPFDDALDRIRAGLIGEAEPMRRFNVFLSDMAVQAKAAELGLVGEGEELNENGKIMARAALIAQGLADAHGDVERTSESLENQTRSLGAEFEELRVEMGEMLIPMFKTLVQVGRTVVAWFNELPEGVKRGILIFAAFAAAAGPVLLVLTTLAKLVLPLLLVNMGPLFLAISALINPFGTLVVMAGKLFVEFGGIGAVLSRILPLFLRFAGPIGVVITLFLLFKDTIADALETVWEYAKKSLGPEVQGLFSAMARLAQALLRAWDSLAGTKLGRSLGELLEMVQALAGYLIKFFGSAVVIAIEVVIDALVWFVNMATDVVNAITALINGDWAGAWFHIGKIAGDTMRTIADWIDWIFPKLAAFLRMKALAFGSEEPTTGNAPGGGNEPTDPGNGANPYAGGDYSAPGKASPSRRRGRTGPTAEALADRREEIRLEHELAVARQRGDIEAVRRLERELDLKDQIDRYEQAGIDKAQARAAAAKDMLQLDQARAEARARELDQHERSIDLDLAELRNDHEMLRALQDEEFLEQRILDYRELGIGLAEAEKRAQLDLLDLEEARADATARRHADAALAHDIELARLRGDFDQADRLYELGRIRDRTDELRRDGLNEADARAQAMREASDRTQAHIQGNFRDAFRSGLRAALDGDLKGFFENWLEDASFDALSRVLDRLADSLANLIAGQSGGGGGLLGSIFGAITGIAGIAGGGSAHGVGNSIGSGHTNRLPGFSTGGWGRIKGFSGIDQNVLSLNGNPIARVSDGELLNVSKGEPGGGGGDLTIRLGPGLEAEWLRKSAGQTVKIVEATAPAMLRTASAKTRRDAARPIMPGGQTG
ncbi:hypothetical protein V5F89_12480 [Pelagerythrobacter marensis]|uniref:Phage tail tape measure protein n=1 Tax=Pelagerythrobacter marensis TaxID=543877 RepID=A0ABZ2D2C1_9SPHN